MIVITLSKCPPAVRGDITKWMFEIDTGVFIGRMSARVRDELWDRIIDHCGDGRVTMVYTARNEQRFEFRTHNINGRIIDLDGIKLFMRLPKSETE